MNSESSTMPKSLKESREIEEEEIQPTFKN